MKTNCEFCMNYYYDDEYECYCCAINLDEDEMYRFTMGNNDNCHYFRMGDDYTIVPAGNIVLYRPKELQKYEYYGEDKTEVYWIHFTGSNVKNILRQYGFPDKERVFEVGTSNEYEQIFKRIIIELQRCQDNYEEMLVLLLRYLLISFHRELTREHILKNEYLDHEMDNAVTFFSENYNQNINIDDYAASRGMSVSWFIRNFKKYTGSTPMQFIVGIRINNAQMLLETTTYSINEISKIVGYDNQLYFIRLFALCLAFNIKKI